jgi:prepilin-type N-terminal cleavage/methylation domain-containing protein
MRNKKGFTLVEIIAVIALIGVVMLLVTPSIVSLFKSAKKSLFQDEVLSLYNNAYTTYIFRSSQGDYTKRFCVGQDSTLNKMDIEDTDRLYYDITVNSYGEVISLKVSDGTFGISMANSNGIKKKNVKTANITDAFTINCNGGSTNPNPPESLSCIITNSKRECNIFNFSYNVENGQL